MNYSVIHICASVSLTGAEVPWKLTCFYGNPEIGSRSDSWSILRHLNSFAPPDWFCMGDFNEILDHSEEWGGKTRSQAQIDSFHSALAECSLGDLGFKGSKFTWSNKRGAGAFIKERLDRALANPGWCRRFPEVEVHVLPICCSEHKPLWTLLASPPKVGRKRSSFRYEACWNLEAECVDIVKAAWWRKT
jgi:hypothetical protein